MIDPSSSSQPAEGRDRLQWTDREDPDVVAFLLVELRRANRTIARLREVVTAARDGDGARVRAALSRVHAVDLDLRPRTSSRPKRGRHCTRGACLGAARS